MAKHTRSSETPEEYQFDGFRFDGVTSMLYLDGNSEDPKLSALKHSRGGSLLIGPAGTNPTALARATPVAFTNTSDQTQTLTAGALSWYLQRPWEWWGQAWVKAWVMAWYILLLLIGHIYLMLANDLIHRVVPSAVTVGEDRPPEVRCFSGVFHHDQHTVTKIWNTHRFPWKGSVFFWVKAYNR